MADPCRVAVIGAGGGGLVVSHRLTSGSVNKRRFDVTVFEQSDHIGGVWFYTDRTDLMHEDGLPVHSAMYKHLRTNLPKEIMAYLDFRTFSEEGPSYCSHTEILSYLNNFCETNDLQKNIQFNVRVTKVRPILKPDSTKTSWQVETEDVRSKQSSVHEFDAIAVCNGHYFVPIYPELPGLRSFHTWMHSHNYRVPDPFTKKRVVCLGGGPSGADIVRELSEVVEKAYLCCNTKLPYRFADNARLMPWPVSCDVDKVIFPDGEVIENVDVILVCTGYKYSYPFLMAEEEEDLPEDRRLVQVVQGKRVTPLYKQLFHINHPSLAFFGLPKGALPFPLMDVQAQVFKKTLEGTVLFPSTEAMAADEARQVQIAAERGTLQRHFHRMTPDLMRTYIEDLEEFGDVDHRMPLAVHKLFKASVTDLARLGICRFRDFDFSITQDDFYERNRDGTKKDSDEQNLI